MKFWFGILLFSLGVLVAVIGLLDLGIVLMFGTGFSLSQEIANTVDQSAGVLLFVGGGCFTMGMLATHFTDFRMTPNQ